MIKEITMSQDPTPTLGQKIDALLEPLYAEAEQHRATIAEVTQQQAALQTQLDEANQGLGEIESRMAEVVRQMAQQEPVIAAVVGQAPAAQAAPPAVEPETEIEPQPEPEAEAESTAEVAVAQAEAVEAQADEPEADDTSDEAPAIELCPEADAEAVDEAAALLDAEPAEAEAEVEAADAERTAEAEAKPEVDLAAAAERAAAAAKKLREKAAAK